MADICAILKGGQDLTCVVPEYMPVQKAVFININDVDNDSIAINVDCDTDNYNVDFKLKEGKKGFTFASLGTGTSVRGIESIERNDKGYPLVRHSVQFLFGGMGEAQQCQKEAFAKGQIVAALKLTDGTVMIYGLERGLSLPDTEIDLVEEGGLVVMTLQSQDNRLERYFPLVFIPVQGDADAIFDAEFEEDNE